MWRSRLGAVSLQPPAQAVILPFRDPDLPRERLSWDVRRALCIRWNGARHLLTAARRERDAVRLRLWSATCEEWQVTSLHAAQVRATIAYDEARIALMKMPAHDKKSVQWKWSQLTNLAARQDQWEDVLDMDEDWLGLAGIRPPPPPSAPWRRCSSARTTTARHRGSSSGTTSRLSSSISTGTIRRALLERHASLG